MNEAVSERDSLPKGWIKTTIDNVCLIILGRSPPSSTYNQDKVGLPFFQGKADFGTFHPTTRNWCTNPETFAEKNDILISVRAPVGPTNISLEKCCIGRGLAAVRSLDGVIFSYVFYHLRFLENYIATKGTGTTFKAIRGDQLRSITLSIPPLNEQKRIVSKIQSIFAQIDTKQQELEKLASQIRSVPDSFAELKGSILKKAFEGRLVPQDPRDEPAEIPLKKIHKGPAKDLDFERDNLPKGWIKTTIDNVCLIILGRSPPSSTYNQDKVGLPFFQGKADFGTFHPTTRNWCTNPETFAEKNDILISVRAPVGPTNISLEKCCIGRGLAAVRSLDGVIFSYVFYHLRFLENYIATKGTGTTFKAIRGDQLRSITLSIPPLNEQKRIVSKIQSIFAQIDTKQQELEKLASQIRSVPDSFAELKGSILKKAFEGRLVPQDSHDEPASVLLERIK